MWEDSWQGREGREESGVDIRRRASGRLLINVYHTTEAFEVAQYGGGGIEGGVTGVPPMQWRKGCEG